jgi:hypothetical protein
MSSSNDREELIKEAVDAAVQKVIDGLSVELDTDYNRPGYGLGLSVTIKMDGAEVASSWLSLKQLKSNLDISEA